MNTNLQIAQEFALGQCLSDYPPNATYDEIIRIINEEDTFGVDDDRDKPLVIVWEPFEYLDVEHIMDNMVSAVERLLHEYRGAK